MSDEGKTVYDSPGCITSRNYYWGTLVAAVLVALIIIALLYSKIVKLRRVRRHDGLYLQLVTDNTWETVKIGLVCVPSEQLFLTPQKQPLILEINLVLGCRHSEAWITWGRRLQASNVSVKREARQILLPRSITISRRLARELESEQGYIRLARLVRQVGGLTSMIPLATPMINGDGWSTIGENLRLVGDSIRDSKRSRAAKGKKSATGVGKTTREAPQRLTELTNTSLP